MFVHVLRALCATILFSLIVVACGGGDEPTTTAVRPTASGQTAAAPAPTAPAGSAVAPTAAPTATTAPRATNTPQPVSSGELTVALAALGNFVLNPGIQADNAYVDAIYDPIIGTQVDGALEADSGLVTSWTANGDSSAWTFKVRDNLVFHNGDKATSADLAYLVSLYTDPKSPFSRAGDVRKSIAKAETPDASTLVLTLTVPDIFWHITWFGRNPPNGGPKTVLPKKYIESVGAEAANKAPVGSGPYKYKSAVVGDRIVTEAVSNHFYFGIPRTKTLTFLGIAEETTRIALMETKSADMTPISVSNAARVKRAGLTTTKREGNLELIIWNSQYPDVMDGFGPNPFANANVRKALFWYAIDRKAIIDSFLGGEGTPSMDYPIMKWDIAGLPPLPVPPYDEAKARQMLVAAGFDKGFEVNMYTIPNGAVPSLDIMEALAVYWEKLGIKMNRLSGTTFGKDLTAVYNKNGFSKPSLYGLIAIGNRNINNSTAIQLYNPQTIFAPSHDTTGFKLANDLIQAKTIAQYRERAKVYREWNYENNAAYIMLGEGNELWARNDKPSSKWQLGQDQYFRLAYAAALR